jgi:hypothetical protein
MWLRLVEPQSEDMLRTPAARLKGSSMHWYEIRLQGHLDPQWSAWFDGLTIRHDCAGDTVLYGPIADEAALHGVLTRVRDLAMPLLSLQRITTGGDEEGGWDG